MAPNLLDCVIHWKKKLDKNPDENITLNVIHKLSKIPITSEILQATHIGKCIRNLSKRDGVVGEKAKIVLNKWRNIFVNLESSRNSKQKCISSKDNVKECSSKQNLIRAKSVFHHEGESSHEQKEKHKKSALRDSHSSKSNPSLCESEMKQSYLNDVNFHHYIETGIVCNSSETSSDDKNVKRKIHSSNDSHALPSLKRKLTTEEKVEAYMNSIPKKLKSENHSSSDSEKEKKHRILVDKDNSFSKSQKKEQNLSSHSKKTKNESPKVKNVKESEKSKSKVKIQSSDGFTSSSVSFEDCLGFSDVVTVKKKKSSKSQSSTKKPPSDLIQVKNKLSDKKVIVDVNSSKKSSHSSKEKLPGNIPKKSKMFDASKDNSASLPAMLPNFRLSPYQSFSNSKKESLTNEDVIKFTSSRKEKTAIYSGRKSFSKGIPTLAQCCYRVLIESIDILGPMVDTPYKILKPVLEKCTPDQLFTIEKYNPQLLYDTNELWEMHCKCDYKLLSPLEHETWRDVYLRGFDEREEKLKNITANISASMLKATPVRQVKLAFIDSYVKPPREVLRRQAKSRLLESSTSMVKPELSPKMNIKKTATVPCSSTSNQNFVADKKESVKTNYESSDSEIPDHQLSSLKGNTQPVVSAVDAITSNKDIIAMSLAAKKPKVAPLMAKTLKTMKQCFRR